MTSADMLAPTPPQARTILTFAARWQRAVAAAPGCAFLSFEDCAGNVVSWTYAAWDGVVARVAGRLVELGVEPGSRVHVALANSPAFVALWLACIRIGAVLVPSDPRATGRELALHVARTRPKVGVCGTQLLDTYKPAAGAGRAVFAIDEDDCSLAGWADGPVVQPAREVTADMPAAILFTSGTTSGPKGVVITQANYAFAGDVMASAAAVQPEDRLLVVLPLFHANAQYYSFAAAISATATVCLTASFSASRFTTQVARHRATHASLFAAPIRMILARGATPVDGCALRHCWYAQNVTDQQLSEFERLAGCQPRQLYGMTETLAAVVTQRPADTDPGVLGEPTPGCDVELREIESDDPVADGEVGELTIGGTPGQSLFAGYLDDAATTQAAFRSGRFRTGDLAVRDPDGRLRFAGRRGDVLKVSGENVSTVEVEEVLTAHPGVFEAAVIGAPDPVRDEVPVAYVVRTPGAGGVDESALLAYAEALLAPSKRPRAIHFVDQLPRTSVGKIRKFLLPSAAPERTADV